MSMPRGLCPALNALSSKSGVGSDRNPTNTRDQ